jgi:hypothetical protein
MNDEIVNTYSAISDCSQNIGLLELVHWIQKGNGLNEGLMVDFVDISAGATISLYKFQVKISQYKQNHSQFLEIHIEIL